LRIWRVGDHSIVDRVRNLSFAAGTVFRRAQEEEAPVEEPILFTPPDAWTSEEVRLEQPFVRLSPAHLRVLGVPSLKVKAVQDCSDFASLEGLGLPQQACGWLEELAIDEASAAELFCPDDLFFKTTLSSLKGYCEGRIKRLMLNLEPEQQQYVDREMAGPMLLKGCAGSGKTTVALYRALLTELDKTPLEQPFDQVVVDEAQDLTAAEIRLASRLGTSVFLVGDVARSIYTRGYTWRDAGLALQGRSFSLRRNFRNTRQVAEAAAGLVRHNVELVASEDWVDPELTRRMGAKPFVLRVAHRDQEIPAICDRILDLAGGGEFRIADFAVLCRFKDQCTRVNEYLTAHHVLALIRDRNSPFDILEQKVKALTIHAAKGVKFPVVFVLGWHEGQLPYLVHDADAERAGTEVEAERMLAYVAMTRAAEVLYPVTSPNRPSRFLDEIPPETVRRVEQR
jgi:superfamily I DNA/RNA helicase